MIWESCLLALQSISRHPLRSFLTTLGVVIGVALVIAMMTLGRGSTEKITKDIAKLGTNLLVLYPGEAVSPGGGWYDTARPLEEADAEAIRREVPSVRTAAPATMRSATAIANGKNRTTQITGTDANYFLAREWPLAEGRIFSESELKTGATVCIVGKTVQHQLFDNMPALGEYLRVGKISCEIIGILEEKGGSPFGQDQDDIILVTLKAY